MQSFTKLHYILAIVVLTAAMVIGLVSIKFLGNDNPIEQIAEEVIQEETGATIDLSPK